LGAQKFMEIVQVLPDTEQFERALAVARSVLEQDRYLTATFPQAERASVGCLRR
jgi:hypothetical protein